MAAMASSLSTLPANSLEDEELLSSSPKSKPPPKSSLDPLLGPGNYYRIAGITGLSRQHVSRVLRGVSKPSLETANRIAQALAIPLEELQDYINHQNGNSEPYQAGRKLGQEQVDRIKGLKGKISCRAAAKEAGVSRTTVSLIWRSGEDKEKDKKENKENR